MIVNERSQCSQNKNQCACLAQAIVLPAGLPPVSLRQAGYSLTVIISPSFPAVISGSDSGTK
jgi:hypothetical protein